MPLIYGQQSISYVLNYSIHSQSSPAVLCNIVPSTLSYKLRKVRENVWLAPRSLYNIEKTAVLNSIFISPPQDTTSLLRDLRRDTAHLLSLTTALLNK